MFEEFGINAGFVEELHARYQQSPQSVEEKWRDFFSALDQNGSGNNGANGNGAYAYSNGATNGASTNGAVQNGASRKEQMLAAAAIQGRVYQLLNAYRVRGHLFAHLTETYCRSIGVEFTQIEEPDARGWLQERMESTRNRAGLKKEQVRRI